MDEDLHCLSREELIAEATRLRNAIRKHRDASEHELCWHHPQMWSLLPEGTSPSIAVPEWPQFLRGCIKYRQSLDLLAAQAPRVSREFDEDVAARAPHEAQPRREGNRMTDGTIESSNEREFVHSRLIDAPQDIVFRAFSQPEHLARWWGPDGFTSTFTTFELRPGGTWCFVMHGPDGTDYPNENVFRIVEPSSRVVLEHISEDHHFFLTITFQTRNAQTLVGWRQVFDTAEHKQSIAGIVGQANEQNLTRLQAEVARMMD